MLLDLVLVVFYNVENWMDLCKFNFIWKIDLGL